MKRYEIKSLTYRDFKNKTHEIEKCINYYFKGKKMVEYTLFKKINFLLWGLDISQKADLIQLKIEDKLIDSFEQEFYVDKNKPSFIIKIDLTLIIEFGQDNLIIPPPNCDPIFQRISIRILQ